MQLFVSQFQLAEMDDWRSESQRLSSLFSKFYSSKDYEQSTDVVFLLSNGCQVKAHKLVLAVSSEVFHAQFYGVLGQNLNEFKVTETISSETFITLIESIYNSGIVGDLSIGKVLDLLYASNFYLLHGNIKRCQYLIMDHLAGIENIEELNSWAQNLSHLSIHEKLFSYTRDVILDMLPRILVEEKFEIFDEKVRAALIEDLRNSISGYHWDGYEMDQEHYWRMLDFAQENHIASLENYCVKEIKDLLPKCFPALLSDHIKRASRTSGCRIIFHEAIKIFVQNIITFKWYLDLEGYEDEDDLTATWEGLSKEAVIALLEECKELEDDDRTLIFNGLKLWCNSNNMEAGEIMNMIRVFELFGDDS